MRGLLRKDFYQLMRHCRFFLIIVVVFGLFGLMGNGDFFFQFYPCIIVSILPVSLCALDENEKWNVYSGTLPISRAQLVSVRYIMSLLLVGAAITLVTLIQIIRLLINGVALGVQLPTLIAVLTAAALLSPAVMLPFVFRFGAERGRLICVGFLVFVTVFITTMLTLDDFSFFSTISGATGIWILLIVAAAVYALSWLISIVVYRKREL